MSKKKVYKLIKELGGKATHSKIKTLAKEKYPKLTLYRYTARELRRLEKSGYVRQDNEGYWIIIKEYA